MLLSIVSMFLAIVTVYTVTCKPYRHMNSTLQFCHKSPTNYGIHLAESNLQTCSGKVDGKDAPLPKAALNLNTASVGFHHRFCQRQTKPHSQSVFGKAAAIKPFKDMIQILRMDAVPRILYNNLCQAW